MDTSSNSPLVLEAHPPESKPMVEIQALSWKQALLLAAGAVASFHLAYAFPPLSFLIAVYLHCLIQLAALPTPRKAFYFGLTIGYVVYTPHLGFLWTIFGWPAVALWMVLPFWLGLFVTLARLCRRKFGRLAVVLVPFVWTGYAFSASPQVLSLTHLGVYGVGLALMLLAASLSLLTKTRAGILLGVYSVALGCFNNVPTKLPTAENSRAVRVAGLQMEFPAPLQVPAALETLLTRHPEAELVVLSEYTFDGPIPDPVKSWCRQHKKHLIAGGKEFLPGGDFYNTAFVVGPDGEIIFRQAKSVPIQFFKDGRAARERKLWESPWGKFGLCICYDLSYRRVTDDLIAQGAHAIIVPTMDVAEWGWYQHELHARVGPVRAAECGVPIFRVCSSGISQWMDRSGRVVGSAPFPGEAAMIAGTLELAEKGHLPLDHWLAPFSVLVTGAILFWLSVKTILGRFSRL